MNKYYTSIQEQDGMFTGFVYNSTNNDIIYQTEPYTTQEQANISIVNFLIKNFQNISSSSTTSQAIPSSLLKTVSTPKHCCGG
jgi:hypothetical protein